MQEKNYPSERLYKYSVTQGYSAFERYALKRSHPRSLFIDTVGLTWFTYFMWQHNWPLGVVALLLCRILSYLAVVDVNHEKMAQTMLGKIALLHLHPVNALTQTVGIVVVYYGVWQHFGEYILTGLSLVFLGHVFGWSQVSQNFADQV